MQYKTGSTLKGYTIKDYINKGGFGDVYSAHQPAINRDVAIKVILPQYANTPDFIRRFEAEAQVIARLEHPYIVPLYDYWRDTDGAYLVMRLLKGGSLKDLIEQQGALALEDIAIILEQISQALHIAHRNNIIHRDIKPGNILLDEDGNAYLADFGIAKDRALSDGVTDPDGVVGSPDYLAPEQARAEPVTPHTDIYSLGVVIYEMLIGEHPFPKLNSVERLFKHLNEPIPDLLLVNVDEQIRYDLNEVVQKATAKNPTERYDDVFALTQAFKEAAQLTQMPNTSLSLVELLTPREQEVLKMLIEGKTNRQIAEALVVEISTVKSHNYEIYRKLKVNNRRQAVVKARHLDLLIADSEALSSVDLDSLPEPENPYKGLQAFQAPDSHLFFGREKFTAKLLKRLQEDAPYKRFLAVVGPSGSGKSSVVKAGLVPEIWRGAFPGSDNWYIIDMVPGSHPLDELEIALTRIATDNRVNLHEQLERDERGLWRVADMILPDDGSDLLLVIDQFEELFTLVENEESRQHFLDLLQTAVTTPRSRVHIVVTLRADYYDKPLQYPEFGEILRSRIETILPLSAEELERTIREPAWNVGVDFEDGLVSRIVSDVHYQPGALPLVQYALTELFERREGRTLTFEAYQAIGGTGGALANRAEEIFHEYDEAGQALLRQMFLRLVTLGEGAEDTRRRVDRAQLLEITDQPELMNDIIDLYADSRLLSLDHDPATRQPTVEVAHEAILREWDRLRTWLNDSREDIRQERMVARAAEEWRASGKDSSFLLRGMRLEQVESWTLTTQIRRTPLEQEFIVSSLNHRQKEANQEAERVEREEQQQQRSRNLLRALVGVFALVAVGAVIFAVIVLNQQQQTQQALDTSNSLVLAAEAIDAHEGGRTLLNLPLLLALRAVDMENPPANAVSALRIIANDHGLRDYIPVGAGKTATVAISPDAKTIMLGGCDNGEIFCPDADGLLLVFDVESRQIIGELPLDAGRVEALAWHPDGDRVAFATADGVHGLFDPLTQEITVQFSDYEGAIQDIVFAVNGESLYGAGNDGSLVIFDANDGSLIETIEAHTAEIIDLDLSTDGTRLITAANDNLIKIWNTDTNAEIMTYEHVPVTDSGLHGAVFAENETAVLISTVDVTYLLWDLETDSITKRGFSGTPSENPYGLDERSLVIWNDPFSLQFLDIATWTQAYSFGMPDRLSNFDIDEEQGLMVAVTTSGHIALMDLAQDRRVGTRRGLSYDLSPDGSRIIVDQIDAIRLFDLASDEVLWEQTPTWPTADFAFSADGQRVVAIGGDAFNLTNGMAITMLDAATGDILWTRSDFKYLGRSVSYSHAGDVIAIGTLEYGAGSDDRGELVLLDAQTGETLKEFDIEYAVFDIMFSEDDSTLIAGLHDDGVRVIDIETGETVNHFIENEQAFSLDWINSDEILIGANTIVFRANIKTGEVLQRYSGFWELVDVGIHPSKPYFLATDYAGTVALVNYATGETLFQVRNIGQTGWNARFTPDGSRAFISDWSFTITEWSFEERPLDELIDWVASNRYLRDFTCAERELYLIEPLCEPEG